MSLPDLPLEILAIIIKKPGEGGYWRLGPWICAGKVTMKLAFTNDVLKASYINNICMSPSDYCVGLMGLWEKGCGHNFFVKCLKAGNPDAFYAEGIWMAVSHPYIQDAIDLLQNNVPECPYVTFSCAVFHICLGNVEDTLENLKILFGLHAREVTYHLCIIGNCVHRDICDHGPNSMDSNGSTFNYPKYKLVYTPDCVFSHDPDFETFARDVTYTGALKVSAA